MENTSGIQPIEFNVVLFQDPVQDRTPGGLMKPADTIEREKHSTTRGTIIAVSPLAFNEDIMPAGCVKPAPGDRVAIAKHAGTFIDGLDGKEYRIVKDKDVVAVLA
jgi:co-chaperonin GroES (HSP10)